MNSYLISAWRKLHWKCIYRLKFCF